MLVSRGHSTGKGLEAGRYGCGWNMGRGSRHWAGSQQGQRVFLDLSWGSLRSCVPSPKPSQCSSRGNVRRYSGPGASHLKPQSQLPGSPRAMEKGIRAVLMLG